MPRHLFHRTGVVVPALAMAVLLVAGVLVAAETLTAAVKPAMADPTQILAAQPSAGGSGIQTGTGITGSPRRPTLAGRSGISLLLIPPAVEFAEFFSG